ncbi:hypothetical protein SAMN05519104_4329 [Rhizobiales bacterium GAS188]|nr:hypothetical protein SAMN05519104_4329 [Rhizobiales bacterium GAS188]
MTGSPFRRTLGDLAIVTPFVAVATLIRKGPEFMTRLGELVAGDARFRADVALVLDSLVKLADTRRQRAQEARGAPAGGIAPRSPDRPPARPGTRP